MAYDKRYSDDEIKSVKIKGRIEGVVLLFISYLILRYGIQELINLLP